MADLKAATTRLEDTTRREREARAALEQAEDRLASGLIGRAEFFSVWEHWSDAASDRAAAERALALVQVAR